MLERGSAEVNANVFPPSLHERALIHPRTCRGVVEIKAASFADDPL